MVKNSLNYKLDNYFLERKDRFNERRGGVCIFIKNNIVYKIEEHDFINNTEYIHIEYFMNNKYFNLVNIYNPGRNINRDEFSLPFTLQNVIICGDFNSKNLIWVNNTTDLNGRLIQELLDKNDLHLLNDGSGRHITFSGNQTTLDLTFVSDGLSHISSWNVENDTLGSDHVLIRIELYQKRKVNEVNSKCNLWNYKKQSGIFLEKILKPFQIIEISIIQK